MAQSPTPVPSEVLKSFVESNTLKARRRPSPHALKFANAVKTVVRSATISSTSSSSRGSLTSNISEDKEVDGLSSPSSNSPLNVAKQMHSLIEEGDESQANSVFLDGSIKTPHAYSPSAPLTNFPTKKSFSSHGEVNVRSVKTSIGPLTKKVCEKLNMSLQLDRWQTKV